MVENNISEEEEKQASSSGFNKTQTIRNQPALKKETSPFKQQA
jgi:hypothetical protein